VKLNLITLNLIKLRLIKFGPTKASPMQMNTFTKQLLATSLLFAASSMQAADKPPVLNGFWAVQFAPSPEGDALKKQLPADAIFINDAGGLELEEGNYGGLELSKAAQQEVAEYDFKKELSAEFACTQPTVPLYMQAPFPLQIDQDGKLIVFRMEYFDMTRVIYLDGRPHLPADAPHNKNGHSIGHWEGDDLVIDTTHISAGTFLNNGFSHSEDLHLVERFRLSADGNTLFATQVSEDPTVFKGKAARLVAWRKSSDYIYPYECDPSFGDLGADAESTK
jgi:hypothetical protein